MCGVNRVASAARCKHYVYILYAPAARCRHHVYMWFAFITLHELRGYVWCVFYIVLRLLQRVFCVASAARCRLCSYFWGVCYIYDLCLLRRVFCVASAARCRQYSYFWCVFYIVLHSILCVFCVASAARCRLCTYFCYVYTLHCTYYNAWIALLPLRGAGCVVTFGGCVLHSAAPNTLRILRGFRCAVQTM
jgi:hypothetical protein